jgi:hypothetical protein
LRRHSSTAGPRRRGREDPGGAQMRYVVSH